MLRDGFKDGLVDAEGVLTERAREAGKRVEFEFPDAETVLSFFAGEAEVEFLCWTADRVALGPDEELSRFSGPWLRGDIRPFEDEVRSMRSDWPLFFDRMLRVRNHAWLPRFEEATKSAGDTFVLMGMAHLAGDEGVIALLNDRGHMVERVQ